MDQGPHRCDESCTCPVHGTPLIYWPFGDDHACGSPGCRYARGMNSILSQELLEDRVRRRRHEGMYSRLVSYDEAARFSRQRDGEDEDQG